MQNLVESVRVLDYIIHFGQYHQLLSLFSFCTHTVEVFSFLFSTYRIWYHWCEFWNVNDMSDDWWVSSLKWVSNDGFFLFALFHNNNHQIARNIYDSMNRNSIDTLLSIFSPFWFRFSFDVLSYLEMGISLKYVWIIIQIEFLEQVSVKVLSVAFYWWHSIWLK